MQGALYSLADVGLCFMVSYYVERKYFSHYSSSGSDLEFEGSSVLRTSVECCAVEISVTNS